MARSGTRHTRALTALMAAPSIEEAAAACGLGVRTIKRYLTDPAFRADLAALEAAAMAQTARLAADATTRAMVGLDAIAADASTPAGVRVSAWRVILDATLRLREAVVLEARVAVLEEAINGTAETA